MLVQITMKLKTKDLLIEIEFFFLLSNIRNKLEVAPLKNLFFLAAMRLVVKDSFGQNKETERMGKTFPAI